MLGPLLFLLYINDIGMVNNNADCNIMLFVDDTNIQKFGKDLNIFKQDMDMLQILCPTGLKLTV